MNDPRWGRRLARWGAFIVLATLVAIPATAQTPASEGAPQGLLNHVSQAPVVRYLMANPEQAPAGLRSQFEALQAVPAAPQQPGTEPDDAFNGDVLGLPQNEESITLCREDPSLVLGGTNDYRGIVDPEGNFTGWHFSMDQGRSLANEGLLPPVEIAGAQVPSGGDPVTVAADDCAFYGGSLNYDPFDPFGQPNGIGVYRSDAATLASCPGGADPSCWPTRRAVAVSEPSHFLDKEWIAVGENGGEQVVWAAYADFTIDFDAPLGFTEAVTKAVRCSADLTDCTEPILISGDDIDVQFADVTVGPDGRTYITWAEIIGELEFTPQTFVIKLRIAPAGSTEFGPEQVVFEETLAIPFGGLLQANDFRVATYPKHEVVLLDDTPRVFVTWDACTERLLDTTCEEPLIKLSYSDDDGATWTDPTEISRGGVNYFPAITADPVPGPDGRRELVAAWFTNRFDRFDNAQDVEMAWLHAGNGRPLGYRRLTGVSNEPEADPLLQGVFIGDYIEAVAHRGLALVHYNANYLEKTPVFGGLAVNQQDNFLRRVRR